MNENDLFLLDGLTESEKEICRNMAPFEERSYEKGSIIYDRTSAEPALGVVLSGRVRVFHGRVAMNDLRAGDIFGAAALFSCEEDYASTVRAMTACRIRLIPQPTLSRWMALYPRVAENYVTFLSDRIRFLNRRLATLTAHQADDRLWHFLTARQDGGGRVEIPGGMAALARTLGVGRSSVYRSLESLTAENRIRRDGNTIFLLSNQKGR